MMIKDMDGEICITFKDTCKTPDGWSPVTLAEVKNAMWIGI